MQKKKLHDDIITLQQQLHPIICQQNFFFLKLHCMVQLLFCVVKTNTEKKTFFCFDEKNEIYFTFFQLCLWYKKFMPFGNNIGSIRKVQRKMIVLIMIMILNNQLWQIVLETNKVPKKIGKNKHFLVIIFPHFRCHSEATAQSSIWNHWRKKVKNNIINYLLWLVYLSY